jgi:hypothetical protein
MKLSHDGLTLWSGTVDAPAPAGEVRSGEPVSMVVGLSPSHPANYVEVRYRVDGGSLRTHSGVPLRTDERKDAQYFRVTLPPLGEGKHVEYYPVAHCAGRQVPRATAPLPWESFTLVQPAQPNAARASSPATSITPRFTPGLTLAAQITVQLKPPIVIGETPHGFRIDYYAKSGTATGQNFKADVHEDSVDYMLVRPDGIGVLDIHATLTTDDGALITASYGGLIEFGEDGYERMVAGNWPDMPKHQVAPRMTTAAPRYRWMNRTQFVGVGQVDMRALVIKYDVYAVATLVGPEAWRKP